MNSAEPILPEELDAIRFYMGDPATVAAGTYRGGPKAYNTINALLYTGIRNELDKIREGKRIEILDPEHLDSYISLILHICSAMKKYVEKGGNSGLCTYRVDRDSAVAAMGKKGYIEGFYSTCKWGFLKEYAATKENVVLMEIRREASLPYLDFQGLFKNAYAKPEEAEILLPPWARVKSMDEIPLTQEEKADYLDRNGVPPLRKVRICLGTPDRSAWQEAAADRLNITARESVGRVAACLESLNRGELPGEEELEFYCQWKKALHNYIKWSLTRNE